MKLFTYLLITAFGFTASICIFEFGGDFSFMSIITGFWTGYTGHLVFSLKD